MPRRYRFGVPALLVVSAYLAAVAVAAAIAPAGGDLGVLWRLTLFTEADESVAVTWPNVLLLVLSGMVWAWALWQSLRGPLAGTAPAPDRNVRRLRTALYVAAASWVFYFLLPSWPSWLSVLDAAVMFGVVVTLQPVLVRDSVLVDRVETDRVETDRVGADHMRGAGLLAYGGFTVLGMLEVLGRPTVPGLSTVCGLVGLVWTVLALRAQWRNGRWSPATVRYGVAALLSPVVVGVMSPLLTQTGDVASEALGALNALMMVWLARSAHDLGDPRHRPVPSPPLPVRSDP